MGIFRVHGEKIQQLGRQKARLVWVSEAGESFGCSADDLPLQNEPLCGNFLFCAAGFPDMRQAVVDGVVVEGEIIQATLDRSRVVRAASEMEIAAAVRCEL